MLIVFKRYSFGRLSIIMLNTTRKCMFLIVALCCISVVYAQHTWVQLGGNTRNMYTEEDIPSNAWPNGVMPVMKWQGLGGVGMAPPVIADGKLYTIGGLKPNSVVTDGIQLSEMWTKAEAKGNSLPNTSPFYQYSVDANATNPSVLLGDPPLENYAFCFDALDGTLMWATKISTVTEFSTNSSHLTTNRAAPLIFDNKLYCMTMAGSIACLDLTNNGAIIWNKNIHDLGPLGTSGAGYSYGKTGIGGSPFAHNNKVYFTYTADGNNTNGADQYITAFNPSSGDVLWATRLAAGMRNHYVSASVGLIDGKYTIVLPVGHYVHGVDAETGAVLWKFDVEATFTDNNKSWQNQNNPLYTSGTCTDLNNPYWGDKHPLRAPCIWGDYVVSRVMTQSGTHFDKTFCIKIENAQPVVQWTRPARPFRGMYGQKDSLLIVADFGHYTEAEYNDPLSSGYNLCNMRPHSDEDKIQCINIRTGQLYWDMGDFGNENNGVYGQTLENEFLIANDKLIVLSNGRFGYISWDHTGYQIEAITNHYKEVMLTSHFAFCNGILYFQRCFANNGSNSFGDNKYNLFAFDLSGNSTPVVKYNLTVTSGSGSGQYQAGETIVVQADAPVSGWEFDTWSGFTQNLSNLTDSADFTMPAQNCTLQAIYKQIPDAVESINDYSDIIVYPNPANEVLFFANLPDDSRIEIFSVVGNQTMRFEKCVSEIDVSGLDSGVYFIKVFKDKALAKVQIFMISR